jgi:hypothetical protein
MRSWVKKKEKKRKEKKEKEFLHTLKIISQDNYLLQKKKGDILVEEPWQTLFYSSDKSEHNNGQV